MCRGLWQKQEIKSTSHSSKKLGWGVVVGEWQIDNQSQSLWNQKKVKFTRIYPQIHFSLTFLVKMDEIFTCFLSLFTTLVNFTLQVMTFIRSVYEIHFIV